MICSQCGSTEFCKNGHKPNGRQRWQCKICGREQAEKPSSDLNSGETYFYPGLSRTREGRCGSPLTSGLDGETQEREMACLETARTDLLKEFPTDIKGEILRFVAHRENQGFKNTKKIISPLRCLTTRGADLRDPESVKEALRKAQIDESTKASYAIHYEVFLEFIGGSWQRPRYRIHQKLPWIPKEEELDQLIAALSPKISTLCQTLKETGARIGEIAALKWTDIDFAQKVLYINNPEKGSFPRIKRISDKLSAMLNTLPRRREYVFSRKKSLDVSYYRQRKRIAFKLSNPRVLKIGFHTFRHWYGTMSYHKVRDIFQTKLELGHKSVRNTEIYVHVEEALFGIGSDEFVSAVAKNVEEARKLVEVGFDYICDFDGVKVFRKRK